MTENPWPIPALRKSEEFSTEYQVVPNARATLDHLRNQLIGKYGSPEYEIVDLDLNFAIPGAFEGILQDVNLWIDNRNTIYVKTECFSLASDDDFIIVYGVNNTQTGFASFVNVSLFGDEFRNGVAGTVFTSAIQYPADEYLPKGNKNNRYYYVLKMARSAAEGNAVAGITVAAR